MCVRFIDLKKKLSIAYQRGGNVAKKKHTQKNGLVCFKKKKRLFFKMMLNKFMLKKNKVRQYQYL